MTQFQYSPVDGGTLDYLIDGADWVRSSVTSKQVVFEAAGYRLTLSGTGFSAGEQPAGTITGMSLVQVGSGGATTPLVASNSAMSLRFADLLAAIDQELGESSSPLPYLFSADDQLAGSTGADELAGFGGHDLITGAGGSDYLIGDFGYEDTGLPAPGNDSLLGEGGNDTLQGNGGRDRLDGGTGNDSLNAGSGNDSLLGGDGKDTLNGGADHDQLKGGAGVDKLTGGAGNDTLTGGGSADQFVLGSLSGSDTLSDFLSGTDQIVISQSGISVGNGNTTVSGAVKLAGPGGFSPSAELVIISGNIAGSLTATSAAAKIGSASSAYAVGKDVLFAVDNGSSSALYLFTSADGNAQVSASELTLLATLGSTPSTSVADFLFG